MAKPKITNIKNHLKHEVMIIDHILKYGYSSEFESIIISELRNLRLRLLNRIIANAIKKS